MTRADWSLSVGGGSAARTPHDDLAFVLRLAAPYFAVAVFWIVFRSAWLAILAYHAQILWWSRGRLPGLSMQRRTPWGWVIAVSALAGPAACLLLPMAVDGRLGPWLGSHGLSGASLAVMVVYFGLVHPVLEQVHWAPLRERSPWAHVAFAGYHMLVLYSLLPVPWLAATSVVLTTASWTWDRMSRESGGLLMPIGSHVAADLGLVVVAWFLT